MSTEGGILMRTPDFARRTLPVVIKAIGRHHLRQAAAIDAMSFAKPWDADAFMAHQRRANCDGRVAIWSGAVVGYVLYSVIRRRLHLERLAVEEGSRRRGVGSGLLAEAAGFLDPMVVPFAEMTVPGDNLPAHLWLRACGWRATPIGGADAYRFELRMEG